MARRVIRRPGAERHGEDEGEQKALAPRAHVRPFSPGRGTPGAKAKVGRPTWDNTWSEQGQYPGPWFVAPDSWSAGPPTREREEIDVADTSAEVTELLQLLIRNACVNDGRPESGGEGAERRPAAELPGGRRPRAGALGVGAGQGEPDRPHRRVRPRGAHPAADGPHRRGAGRSRGLAGGPVRRRPDRRHGVGTRRRGHAEPDGVDGGRREAPGGGRVRPEGDADLRRASRTRRHSAPTAPSGCCGSTPTRSAPTTSSPSRAGSSCRFPRRPDPSSRSSSPRRAPTGARCGCAARPATRRCRSEPTTRW